VPFIAHWPGHVPPGQSDQLICHVDLFAAIAAMLSRSLPDDAAIDSFNIFPSLMGDSRAVRDHLVHHTGGFPGTLAIRQGSWKLVEASERREPAIRGPLLFNLVDDPAEKHDKFAAEPHRARNLAEQLARIREGGRSRP
jgi:arylsulfatase A-like enzyme